MKNTPQFPFGHGYSKFEYSGFELSSNSLQKVDKIEYRSILKIQVSVMGKEVVQLYIRDLIASVTRPVKELKGFELMDLQPNETKKVVFN
jgi:beta-glucosidase